MLRLSPYPCHEDASLPNSPQRSKSSPTSLRSPFVSRNGQRAKPPPLLWTHSPRLTYQELWARTDSPTAPASICDTPLGLYNFKYCTPSRTPSLSSIAAAPSFPSPCKKLEEDDLFATPAAPLHMPGESDESPVLRRTESVGSLPQSQPISSSLNFRSHSISAQSDGSEYLELCYLGSTVPALIYSRSGSQSDTFSTPLSSPSVGFATSTSPLTPLTPLTPEHYGRSPGGYMRSSPSSSLGSLSSQSSPLLQPARSKLQKRKRQDPESPTPRTRVKSGSALILPGYGSPEIQSAKDENPQAFRTFPPHMPVHAAFPGFYTRFRVSSYHQQNTQLIAQMEREGTYQPPGSPLDLYTPRFVKGIGRTKMGLCPICIEGEGEGKPGEKRWLYMKTSAYNYHMQYYHGISPTTHRPFSPPTAFRIRPLDNAGPKERKEMTEGRCHRCRAWIGCLGIKDVEVKVPEIYWWKHAAACHRGSEVEGEEGWFVEDGAWAVVVADAAA